MNGEKKLNREFWNERWRNEQTGWDIGYPSPPIEEYIRQYGDKNAKVLIPGCGNAYEAEFLLNEGFTDITILDISDWATEVLKERFKNHPEIKVVCEDFFTHQGKYDLIIEQTFFCAIPPEMRNDYVRKSWELLHENGKIIGVLFARVFEKQGPPFGGTAEEYEERFRKHFETVKLEKCYNSIAPRRGNEIFINMKKK